MHEFTVYPGGVRLLLALLTPTLLLAGTEPRAEAAAYEAHATLAQGELGAEYLSRTVGAGNVSAYIGKYVAVEVALFPAKGTAYAVASGHFRLRINRAGRELSAQPAGIVASTIENPQYERQGGLETGGGYGPADVVFGKPRRTERFPGDPDARRPGDNRNSSKQTGEPSSEADAKVIREAALYEGTISSATSGVLYFAFGGKLKDVRSIELLYDGPAGKAVLKLK
jgi:hypothetical protein